MQARCEVDQYRCPGSATDNFTDDRQTDKRHPEAWDAHYTARCGCCGKRVGLYSAGSSLARECGNADLWRMKTHYIGRRLTTAST